MMQDILDIEIPLEVKLSPDCRSVVYMTRLKWYHKTDERRTRPLWIADVGAPMSARPLTDGLFADRLPRWSPSGNSVAFLSDRGTNSGKSVALYQLDLTAEAEPKALTPTINEKRISKFLFSPEGKSIAYITTDEESSEAKARKKATGDASVWGQDWDYAHLKLVDINTGDITTIFDRCSHVVDFSWGHDSTKVAVVTHQTPDAESHHIHGYTISIVDVTARETSVVAHLSGEISYITWSKSFLFFLSNHIPDQNTSGFAVYSIDLAGAAACKDYDCQKIPLGDDSCPVGIVEVDGEIMVKIERGTADELRLVGSNQLILSQQKGIRNFDGRRGRDGNIVLALAQGDVNTPTEVFSLNSGQMVRLTDHGSILKDKTFGHCNFVQCESADGKEALDGVFLTPVQHARDDGKPKKPLPTLVLLHGGPYTRMTNQFDSWNPLAFMSPILLSQGYAVLMPNYRGSSGRGQQFASYSKGGMGIYDEPDVVTMTQYVVAEGWSDKNRLLVGGWSQGGYLSYLSAVRNGAHGLDWAFRGAICGAGVTDWDALVLTSDVGYEQAQYAGCAPWTASDKNDGSSRTGSALWEFKAAAETKRIPPMLILHGEQDRRVPVSQAHGFRRALDKAGLMGQTEFVTYPREGHYFTERKHVEDLMERMVRFINKCLS